MVTDNRKNNHDICKDDEVHRYSIIDRYMSLPVSSYKGVYLYMLYIITKFTNYCISWIVAERFYFGPETTTQLGGRGKYTIQFKYTPMSVTFDLYMYMRI